MCCCVRIVLLREIRVMLVLLILLLVVTGIKVCWVLLIVSGIKVYLGFWLLLVLRWYIVVRIV
jgi:hypothetical protein